MEERDERERENRREERERRGGEDKREREVRGERRERQSFGVRRYWMNPPCATHEAPEGARPVVAAGVVDPAAPLSGAASGRVKLCP